MRSALLMKLMEEGQWTNERIHARLQGCEFGHLRHVTAGTKCPSASLALAIKEVIVPRDMQKDITLEQLFPLLRHKLPVSSIDTEGTTDSSMSRHARTNSIPARPQNESTLSQQ